MTNHLRDVKAIHGAKGLVNYVSFALTRLELVVIEAEELSSALKIFETINQRGAGLNAMDLVKNLLSQRLKSTSLRESSSSGKKSFRICLSW